MDRISQMLSRCAVAMLGPSSIQQVLDRFVAEVVGVMAVDGAGAVVLPTAAAPGFLAASDATAMDFERLQSELHQGPCILAHSSARAVSVPDLASDTQFREFAPAARALGLASAFAFPLRLGDVSLGALDLYRTSTGGLGEEEMLTAQMLADVLAAYLVSAQTQVALAAAAERDENAVRHLRELNDDRTDFVSTIIHELRTPLAGISGFTELLEEQTVGLSDQQRHYVSAIHRNSRHLGALTADLLALFRLEPGAMRSPRTEVDLRAVIATVQEALDAIPEAGALDVVFVVPDQPIVVYGRRGDLERMLSNLISNAVKYTPAGGTVTCSLSHEAGHATLEVRDTGIGISAEEQRELFTKFFRASTATTRGIEGTGLGLAIVKSVVLGHAGVIEVFSTVDAGTRFVVRLPLAPDGT